MKPLWIILLLFPCLVLPQEISQENSPRERKKKFSIFNVVQFENRGCISLTSFVDGVGGTGRNGTCLATEECSARNGTQSGPCASGFGVCCLLFVQASGSYITHNLTYIQNLDFPKVYITPTPSKYIISKQNRDICFIRLDFETFSILGPAFTDESDGGLCSKDALVIKTTSGQKIPIICGVNTGQHIYVDVRGSEKLKTVQLYFTFTGTSTNRLWDISTKFIECNNLSRPPEGCLQYWATTTGQITTFNFAASVSTHLANQDVSACVRREKNFCCIVYQVCSDIVGGFSLDSGAALDVAGVARSEVNEDCSSDYVGIAGSSGTYGSRAFNSKYCSPYLDPTRSGYGRNVPIYDCTPPFFVYFHSDAAKDPGQPDAKFPFSRGVCLNFSQLPCR